MQLPSLDEIAARPELATALTMAQCAGLVVRAAAVQAALGARIATAATEARLPSAGVLSLQEAAKILGMAPSTLRKRLSTDPVLGALRLDNRTKRLVFDRERIARFLQGSLT